MKLLLLEFFIVFTSMILFDVCKSNILREEVDNYYKIMVEVRNKREIWCVHSNYFDLLEQLVAVNSVREPSRGDVYRRIHDINTLLSGEPLLSDNNIRKPFDISEIKNMLKQVEKQLLYQFLLYLIGNNENMSGFDTHQEDVRSAINRFLNFFNRNILNSETECRRLFDIFLRSMDGNCAISKGLDVCNSYFQRTRENRTQLTAITIVTSYRELKESIEHSRSPIVEKISFLKSLDTMYRESVEDFQDQVRELYFLEYHYRRYLERAALAQLLVSYF